MSVFQQNLKEKSVSVVIGQENLSFQPESKKSIDLEMFFINILLLGLVFAYSSNYLTLPIFLPLFYAIAMRFFIGNHDRMHASQHDRLPRFFEAITEGFAVVVTPWDEPFDSVKWKHLKHHSTHVSGKSAPFDTKSDPHSAFELGGFLRVFISCVFYEEIQLYFDIRDRKLTRSRLYRFLIYTPLLIAFIYTFGLNTYLIVLLAMKITGFSVWFLFSWGLHQPVIYNFGFAKQVPIFVNWITTILFGRRISAGITHHSTHHAWPSIPYNQLDKFDSATLRNPEYAPEMLPIGA
ncbi:MAG: fatty acid desaturase [Bacteroidota bacterium]